MHSIIQDFRFAARMFLRRPGVSVVAAATLALGIGANVTAFTMIQSIFLRPLPYANPGRLAQVWESDNPGNNRDSVSPGHFLALQERSRTFEGVGALAQEIGGFVLTGNGRPERLSGLRVSADLLPILGASPSLGRGFEEADDQYGAPPVVILLHGFWKERFGSDPGLVGREVTLNGVTHTVVGVMGTDFSLPVPGIDLLTPLSFDAAQRYNYGPRYLALVGRLAPASTWDQAALELKAISKNLIEETGGENPDWSLVAVPLHQSLVERKRTALLTLFGVVSFVFLIACANVSSVFLAHSQSREREMAVRRALGAGTIRLVRQMVCEAVLISGVAGALGLLAAFWGTDFLRASQALSLPATFHLGLDRVVVAFAVLTTGIGALLVVALPAARLTRPGLASRLGAGGRTATSSTPKFQKALAIGELALTLIALTGAGLLVSSFLKLVAVETGFDSDRVLALEFSLAGNRYPDTPSRVRFYDALREQVGALPGVESAGVINFLPLRMQGATLDYLAEGQVLAPGQWQGAAYRLIGPGYLETMRTPLLQGRTFDAREIHANPLVAIVDESVARNCWPGESPIGKRLRWGDADPANTNPWLEVVGVVGSAKLYELTRQSPVIYVPYTQEHEQWAMPRSLVVRSRTDPTGLRKEIESALWSLDPDVPISDVAPMDEIVSGSLSDRRAQTVLVSSFGVLALALAVIGVYGVVSFGVGLRTREFGVRMALGADSTVIKRLVLKEGLVLLVAGFALGSLGSWGLSNFLESQLFGVKPGDAVTTIAVSLVVSATTLAACWIPARRATRVDPAEALRC